MQLEKACPICDSCNTKTLYRFNFGEIIHCLTCAVQSRYPQPSNESCESIYQGAEYFTSPDGENFFGNMEQLTDKDYVVYNQYLDILQDVDKKAKSSSIVDVGTAFGLFTDAARKKGFVDVIGTEISAWAAARGKELFGVDIICGPLENCGLSDESKDIVTAFDVIEHVHNPTLLLCECHRILRPGGLLILATPNYRSLFHMIGKLMYVTSRGRVDFLAQRFYVPHHLFYFDPYSLTKLAHRCGFQKELLKLVEYPLYKINLNKVIKVGVRIVYCMETKLGLSTSMILVCRKVA